VVAAKYYDDQEMTMMADAMAAVATDLK